VSRYDKDHYLIPGQSVPSLTGTGFVVLRCIRCTEVYEPNVQSTSRDALRKTYDEFLDEMEAEISKTTMENL